MDETAPRLVAYRVGPDEVMLMCDWCHRRHFHGGYGLRVARCRRPDSPYLETGYYLIHPNGQ